MTVGLCDRNFQINITITGCATRIIFDVMNATNKKLTFLLKNIFMCISDSKFQLNIIVTGDIITIIFDGMNVTNNMRTIQKEY